MHNYFTKQALLYRSESDSLFDEWVKDQPKYPPNWPGGIGPNYLDSLKLVIGYTRPKSILEIGFNLGGSSACWLNLWRASVLSIDNNQSDIVKSAGETLKSKFPKRFDYILCKSEERQSRICETGKTFDLIFIDGDHTFDGVMTDIALARSLGITRMLFDDWLEHWGPGVAPAINKSGLKLVLITNNLAYCEEMAAGEWKERISMD